jgi:hypothetical protein
MRGCISTMACFLTGCRFASSGRCDDKHRFKPCKTSPRSATNIFMQGGLNHNLNQMLDFFTLRVDLLEILLQFGRLCIARSSNYPLFICCNIESGIPNL